LLLQESGLLEVRVTGAIMYTTNTASHGIPTTYSLIRAECEELLKIAKEMEQIALVNSRFLENNKFSQLTEAFHSHFTGISGLSNS
jgi:hypothetical protein